MSPQSFLRSRNCNDRGVALNNTLLTLKLLGQISGFFLRAHLDILQIEFHGKSSQNRDPGTTNLRKLGHVIRAKLSRPASHRLRSIKELKSSSKSKSQINIYHHNGMNNPLPNTELDIRLDRYSVSAQSSIGNCLKIF